jgi:hypothetical protein
MFSSSLSGRCSLRLLTLLIPAVAGMAMADPINWQSLEVSTLQSTGGFGMTFNSLPDGRFVLGQQQTVLVQDTFGAAASTELAGNGITFDPSFVTVRNGTSGLMGQGGSFGAISGLHPFDPTNPTAGTGGIRPALPTSLQTYTAVYWHSPTSALEGWLVGGSNGPNGPLSGHNITFVSLDGTKSGPVTDELSTYSAGMAVDTGGNLYAALYELDGSPNAKYADRVIRFSAAQLEPKIQAILDDAPATPLSRNAALFIHKFRSASSLAVDGLGRLWAAGFKVTNVEVFDPATSQVRVLLPAHDPIGGGQDTYQLSTFTRSGVPSIGVLAYDSWMFSGTPVFCIHAPASEVDMPNAATYLTWRASYFGAAAFTLGTEESMWGDDADPDQDGLGNLVEYSQNTSPLSPNEEPPIVNGRDGSLLTLSFLRHPACTDLTYAVQVSTDLVANSWTTIASSAAGAVTTASGASAVSELAEGELQRVMVTDGVAAATESRRFIRLRIAFAYP